MKYVYILQSEIKPEHFYKAILKTPSFSLRDVANQKSSFYNGVWNILVAHIQSITAVII